VTSNCFTKEESAYNDKSCSSFHTALHAVTGCANSIVVWAIGAGGSWRIRTIGCIHSFGLHLVGKALTVGSPAFQSQILARNTWGIG
jgi:hypothetical protein